MLVSALQLENADLEIDLMAGMLTLVSFVQDRNAHTPMLSTEGKLMPVRAVQLRKT